MTTANKAGQAKADVVISITVHKSSVCLSVSMFVCLSVSLPLDIVLTNVMIHVSNLPCV